MDDQEERKKLYSEYRNSILTRQLSNSENFDKAILSLSTASLGFSLAFITDVVRISEARYMFLLHLSWYFFAVAIVSTLVSFVTSQKGLQRQLFFAEQYYIHRKEEFFKKENKPAKLTNYLNNFSCVIFISAVFLTVIFVSLNVSRSDDMAEKKTIQPERLKEGQPIPSMQELPSSQSSSSSTGNDDGGNPAGSPSAPSDTSSNQGTSSDQGSANSGDSTDRTSDN
jgi:hypothetical protein